MKKICIIFVLAIFLVLGALPGCKKKLPTSPDIPDLSLRINYFTATPESVFQGEVSVLSWSVKNAINVTIDQGIGAVSEVDTMEVSPEETITYTLTAINKDVTGLKTASVTVVVTLGAIFEVTSHEFGYWHDVCCITGIVTNVGNDAGYDVMIEFIVYDEWNIILATEWASLSADSGIIPVGDSSYFRVIFQDIEDCAEIAKVIHIITWVNGIGVTVTQKGGD